jgi:RNA polymerase sigma-70 factor, ECF subfamily
VTEETDGQIIFRSLDDAALFEQIFDRHYDIVRVYAQRRIGMDDGEEIAASTFEHAFAQRARFDRRTFISARPWLMGIANNLVRRHLRHEDVRLRYWPTAIAVSVDEAEPSLDAIDAERQGPLIRAALSELSDQDRETFLLVVLGELSYGEVAEIVDVPLGTVRSRVNRARRKLRELLAGSTAINHGEEDQESPQ